MPTVERLRADIERLKARYAPSEGVASDRVEFAESLGIEPDLWQAQLLRSGSRSVLMNCSRQSGKSTMAAVLALHRALTEPDALVLILARTGSKTVSGAIRQARRPLPGAR